MSKVKHTFVATDSPEVLQAMFLRDIRPELHRQGRFVLTKETPGCLKLSDGEVDPMAFGRDGFAYAGARGLLAHRIEVQFSGEVNGTRITLTGSVADRKLRDALLALGTPGHWPEVSGGPIGSQAQVGHGRKLGQ